MAAAVADDSAVLLRPRPRTALRRFLGAVLVFRLELRQVAPLDPGLVLLAWLRQPVIEMPARPARAAQSLRRRLDEVYPF